MRRRIRRFTVVAARQLPRDLRGREDEIDASRRDRGARHLRELRRLFVLREGDAAVVPDRL